MCRSKQDRQKKMLRKAIGVTAFSSVAATGLGYFWAKKTLGDDAVERNLRFNRVAVPAIIDYKLLEAKPANCFFICS